MLTVLSYTVLMLLHSLWLLTLLQPHMSLYQFGCTQILSRAFSLPFKEISGCNSKQAVNAPKWHCSAFTEVQWEQNWMCCRNCTPCKPHSSNFVSPVCICCWKGRIRRGRRGEKQLSSERQQEMIASYKAVRIGEDLFELWDHVGGRAREN